MSAATAVPAQAPRPSANDRFKESFRGRFWGSMILATVVHFAVLQYAPELTADDFSFSAAEFEAIELPPEIEIPPPPQQVARPATPIMSEVDVSEDITIAPTTFEMNPVEDLPPPPDEIVVKEEDISAAPAFTPYTVGPMLLNRNQVARAMVDSYPESLRRAGIGGIVRVYFFVNREGEVQNFRIHQSSGFVELDEAALAVADVYQFSPAMNRDKVVPVWVSLPIEFQVR
ncbi:MAG: energy transducer TonB [Gemmatimonadota bacterium]|nr:energy transducer TonB [Gemmatimonadota bacterium]MDH3422712.1 energy transducer TonB [Gemmatimonadota bacterium]